MHTKRITITLRSAEHICGVRGNNVRSVSEICLIENVSVCTSTKKEHVKRKANV